MTDHGASRRTATRMRRTTVPVLALTALLTLTAVGCASDGTSSAEAIAVSAGDDSCQVARTDLTAGTNTLRITNTGTKVTEVYVYAAGGRIVTERENIGPGTTTEITFEVEPGEYEIACKPGQTGDGIRQKVRVSAATTAAAAADPRLTAAVTAYRAYVRQQADASRPELAAFVAAVKASDLDAARTAYPRSRQGWERVEPVAESFGDLDPRLDLREADREAGQDWTGWHRLEKAVFTTRSVTGQAAYADRLLADYDEFRTRTATATITTTSMANGAKELLDEVATGKITGEEDVWSGTDLWDFAANVEGAEQVYRLLRPIVSERDAALRDRLDAAFTDVHAALAAYRSGQGYVDYRTVTQPQRRELATKVDALAEPLSMLAATVGRTA